MPLGSDPNLWSALGALLIALVSGLVAIAMRLAKGQTFTWIWFGAQLGGAILVGYIVWDMYPHIKSALPAWATQPLLVSIAAHYGGKAFDIAESLISRRLNLPPGSSPN